MILMVAAITERSCTKGGKNSELGMASRKSLLERRVLEERNK